MKSARAVILHAKAGFRYGDALPMAVIEPVDRDETARPRFRSGAS